MGAFLINLKERLKGSKRHERVLLCSGRLLKAVAESEKGYLALGRDLHAFHEKAKEVSTTSSSLFGLMKGGQLIDLSKGLEGTSEKMKDVGAESREGTNALRSILEKAGTIETNLFPFRNVVRTLQVLCSFISIESVRLGAEKGGFDALSGDVRNLARTIQEKSSHIMEQSSALTNLVRENLARMLRFEKDQQERSRAIAESIKSQLRTLTERDEDASLKLERMESTSEGIAKSIGEIVSSLQFHDITRQRIDHVAKALEKTEPAPEEAGGRVNLGAYLGRFFKAVRPVSNEETYKTYQLQKAQLLHTREELTSATEKISGGLQALAGRIRELSEEAGEVTREAKGKRASIFSEMEQGILKLHAAIHEYEQINTEIASGVEGFTTAVSEMEGFLRDIVKIGIEMKMIALNAAIHAAHVGQWGLALGVLADHIHRLSQETSGRIDQIGEDLHSIFDHAQGLKSFASLVSSEGAGERAGMVESLTRMIPSLKDLNARSILLLEDIEKEGEILSMQIEERAAKVHFHEPILLGIDALTAEIDRQCAGMESRLAHLGRGDGKRSLELQGLAQKYTMQKERDVHESILGAAGLGENPPPAVKEPEGKPAGDFGENVELF